jgi:hypothetical protein
MKIIDLSITMENDHPSEYDINRPKIVYGQEPSHCFMTSIMIAV